MSDLDSYRRELARIRELQAKLTIQEKMPVVLRTRKELEHILQERGK